MSSLSLHSDARPSGQTSLGVVLALVMLVVAAAPADAQQRIEITTKRTVPRSDLTDSLRRLQRQVDSLSHAYNEDDQLSVVQRRKVEEDLARTVERLDDLSSRMNGGMLAPAAPMGVRVGRADAEAMTRALMQVREFEQAMPRGWIGFVAQGPALEPRVEGGELIVRYFAYPRIISVDPSSPAQRAGITTNDTLIAYDGRDVRENEISLTRLLRPNARVRVRLLRDGRVFEIPVTVAAVPSRIVARRDDEVRGGREPWSVPDAPSFPRIAMAPPVATGGARVTVSAAQPSIAPTPGARPVRTIFLGMTNAGVAGAQLSTITKDFSDAMGLAVTSGVLVMNAPLGSLAYESGLRDGDIITKAGGQVVRSVSEVRDLVRLASDDGEHAIEVDVLRQKRAQRIVLKW
ncbi:MAG: PDZ domain-containing protein [Gemmatimonadaceae bacterium]